MALTPDMTCTAWDLEIPSPVCACDFFICTIHLAAFYKKKYELMHSEKATVNIFF